MPKHKMKKKARRRKMRPENSPEFGGFSFLGLIAGLAVIAAGFAYTFGYFPESFETASFQLPNLELPKLELPEVPHSN